MTRLATVMALVLAIGGGGGRAGAGSSVAPGTPAAAPVGRMTVRVDKRIELVSIVMRLAGAPEYKWTAAGFGYADEVDRAFGPFAQHAAVAATRELRRTHGIGYDAPMYVAIALDDNLQLRPGAVTDARWTGVDIAAYAAQLRAFAADAKYDAFFAAHAAFYRGVEASLQQQVDAEHPLDWFDARFGPRKGARYIVAPGMLVGKMSYGPHVDVAGGVEMYQVLGVTAVGPDGAPKLDAAFALLVHEIAHSYVNPVFDAWAGKLAPAGQTLWPAVEAKMRPQAYTDWQIVARESGVRAVQAEYQRERHGDAAARAAIVGEARLGFAWTATLEVAFARDRKKSLEATMPDVVAAFDAVAAAWRAQPPALFQGPIDAAITPHVAFALTADAAGQYGRRVRELKFALSAVGAPDAFGAAAKLGATGDVMAYGTPAANPLVAAVLSAHHATVAADRVVIDGQTFTGAHLVVIACAPRPGDPAHGIVAYTAADPADVDGINGLHAGLTDWVVGKRDGGLLVPVATGDHEVGAAGAWK